MLLQDASLLRFLVDMRGEDATNQQVGLAPLNSLTLLGAARMRSCDRIRGFSSLCQSY